MATTIAVAGKGGTGKTTVAALLIQCLCESRKGPVLAIDADPDANLGQLLGIRPEKTIGELREDILREMKNFPAGMSKADYVQAGLHQLIEEADGFDLITMGQGEGPGCYCSLNNLIRKFSEDLTPSYPWVVMDNEAGLEHISRRTTSKIDLLLIVVNQNPVSFDTAKRIVHLADTLKNGIGRTYVVANMITREREDAVRERIAELPGTYVGTIPWDAGLEHAVFERQSIKDLDNSEAKQRICSILQAIGGGDANT
jgi:CO dehydrogenase maturation factor